jgi:dihydrofolate reductase
MASKVLCNRHKWRLKVRACVAGGANTAQQFLRAGLLEELQIHLVLVLIGQGIRLFDGLEDLGIKLEKTRSLESCGVMHLRYRVIK